MAETQRKRFGTNHSKFGSGEYDMSDKTVQGEEEQPRKRTVLKEDTLARLRLITQQLIDNKFGGSQANLARAIGISQAAISKMLQGGGASVETAIALASEAGVQPVELLREELRVSTLGSMYPNLEKALDFEGEDAGRWPTQLIQACRAGIIPGPDVPPKRWVRRLDFMTKRYAEFLTELQKIEADT